MKHPHQYINHIVPVRSSSDNDLVVAVDNGLAVAVAVDVDVDADADAMFFSTFVRHSCYCLCTTCTYLLHRILVVIVMVTIAIHSKNGAEKRM